MNFSIYVVLTRTFTAGFERLQTKIELAGLSFVSQDNSVDAHFLFVTIHSFGDYVTTDA